MRDKEGKVYIGNSKPIKTSKPVSAKDIPSDDEFKNIPERKKQEKETDTNWVDDLPF